MPARMAALARNIGARKFTRCCGSWRAARCRRGPVSGLKRCACSRSSSIASSSIRLNGPKGSLARWTWPTITRVCSSRAWRFSPPVEPLWPATIWPVSALSSSTQRYGVVLRKRAESGSERSVCIRLQTFRRRGWQSQGLLRQRHLIWSRTGNGVRQRSRLFLFRLATGIQRRNVGFHR